MCEGLAIAHSNQYHYLNKQIDAIKTQLNLTLKNGIFSYFQIYIGILGSPHKIHFTDVVEWVGKTFDIVSVQKYTAICETHPAEFNKHKGELGIIGAVKAKGFEIPKNVSIIDNKWQIKP